MPGRFHDVSARTEYPDLAVKPLRVITLCSFLVAACSAGVAGSPTITEAVGRTCDAPAPSSEVGRWASGHSSSIDKIAASRQSPGVIWGTTNDGEATQVVGFDRDGQPFVRVSVPEWANDVVAIALGPAPGSDGQHVYVAADLEAADSISLLWFPEPEPGSPQSERVAPLEAIYGTGPRQIRGMFIDPDSGDAYFITSGVRGPGLFYAAAPLGREEKGGLNQLAILSPHVDSVVTGADISSDGRHLAISSAESVALWTRSEGEPIREAVVRAPCVVELRTAEGAAGVAFGGAGNQFLTLDNAPSPNLVTHRPPPDIRTALDSLSFVPPAGNLAPLIAIEEPTADHQWSVGEVLPLSASITDDDAIEESSVVWTVTTEHCAEGKACVRQRIAEVAGSRGQVSVEPVGYSLPVDLEVSVTYEDAGGMTATYTTELQPVTATISIASDPPGAEFTIGDEVLVAPASTSVIRGDRIEIAAPRVQNLDGVDLAFGSWSSGEARTHRVDIAEEDLDFTLELVPASSLAPASIAITSPRNNSRVSGPYITIAGRADGGFGRGVDRNRLVIVDQSANEYWDGDEWTSTWSWIEPLGLEEWSYEIRLDDGSYLTRAWTWDVHDDEWLSTDQYFFTVR